MTATNSSEQGGEGKLPENICPDCNASMPLSCDPTGEREFYRCFGCDPVPPQTVASNKRTMLYYWDANLNVLIPKLRGNGFLKVPVGHHSQTGISIIENTLRCDIYGLDGYVCVDCGTKVSVYHEKRAPYAAKAMPLLANHFKCDDWREVGNEEFFKLLNI